MASAFKKSFLTATVFIGLSLLPISCDVICNDSCGCGPDFDVKDFSITSMESITLVSDGQQVSSADTYPFDEVVKGIRVDEFQTLAMSESYSQVIPGFALACSPRPSQSVENLADIKIINSAEVKLSSGEKLKIGDDISEYFGINYYFSEGTQPISDFLEDTLPIFSDDLLKLAWLNDPMGEISLKFTIQVILDSGREISLTDEVLNIH